MDFLYDFKMPTCIATLKTGSPCTAPSRPGFPTCGRHKRCLHVSETGITCVGTALRGDTLCEHHRQVAREKEIDEYAEARLDQFMDMMWSDTPPRTRDELDRLVWADYAAGRLDEYARDGLLEIVEEEWDLFVEVRPPPRQVARSELHALVLDAQNVHTSAVNKQTSGALTILLETPVPPRQHTLDEVTMAWTGKKDRRKVVRDMEEWYVKSECRAKKDWLYMRVLDGLWVRIKGSRHKDDLVARLWEECSESVGVCCEGHLSRLANVLVGFDEKVAPEVSVGELLQQKMAVVAGLDVSVEQKVGHAWAVFEELGVPMEERDVWVDAL
jgi:hypothetical protein